MKKKIYGSILILITTLFLTSCNDKGATTGTARDFMNEAAEGEEDLVANSSFAMTNVSDCENAFTNPSSNPFLSLIARRKGWNSVDIERLCTKINTIRTTYQDNSTLTIASFAGVGKLSSTDVGFSYYIGIAMYDITYTKDWIKSVVAKKSIRRCMRRARGRRILFGSIPKGFVIECIERLVGSPAPSPVYRNSISNIRIDQISGMGGRALATLGFSLAIYNVPGRGTVIGFLGGAFYANAESTPYASFLGCGAAVGFNADEVNAIVPICFGAEFSAEEEGNLP